MNKHQNYQNLSKLWDACLVYIVMICRSYDALIGVTSNDWFHQQRADFLERGVSEEDKKRLIRSYILNNYENHLKEIFLSVENEYSEWDQVRESINV